jgi:hypothetical protein
VGEWDQFFSTIKAGTLDQEEIGLAASEAAAVACERATTGGLVSPRKRTANKRTRQQVEAEYNTFGSFVATHMIEGGDVESSMNSIGDLQHQMNFLVKKVKKTEMSQMTYPSDEADRSIIGLRNLVGSRPAGMAQVSILELMHNLTELIVTRPEGDEVKSVMQLIRESSGQLTQLEVRYLQSLFRLHGNDLSGIASKLCGAISKQIRDRFMIVDKFISQCTTFTGSPPEYGERLSTAIDTLEAKLNSIASLTPPSQQQRRNPFDLGLGGPPTGAAHPHFGMHGLSLGHNRAQDQPGGTDSMKKLMVTVKVVQQEIELIKKKMDDTIIDAAGQKFNSKRELQAWLVTHARLPEEQLVKGKTDIHILFPDALG